MNSKQKGNRNERMVAKLLTQWTGHEFVRVPASGGLQWKNRADVCGDVISSDPDFNFHFSVETKHMSSLGLNSPILRKNSCIYTFMTQCQQAAQAVGKRPFLMVRENRMPKEKYYIFLPITITQNLWFREKYGIPQFIGQDQEILGFVSTIFFYRITYDELKLWYR